MTTKKGEKSGKNPGHRGEDLIDGMLQNLTVNNADPSRLDAIDAERDARDVANAKPKTSAGK